MLWGQNTDGQNGLLRSRAEKGQESFHWEQRKETSKDRGRRPVCVKGYTQCVAEAGTVLFTQSA